MPSNTFVARLSRGAAASTIAVSCLVPEGHSAVTHAAVPVLEMAMPEQTFVPEAAGRSDHGNSVMVNMPESVKEWTKKMEREFRQLALGEAKGNLTGEQMARLEGLSLWRERLSNPRPADEVLLQLKNKAIRVKRTLNAVGDLISSFRAEVELMIPEIQPPLIMP